MRNQQQLLGRITVPGSATEGLPSNAQAVVGSLFISGDNNTASNITNNVVSGGRMSKIVSLDGTDRWFQSQADAGRELGLSAQDITNHLNHGRTLPNDISLTRRGVSA